MKYGIVASLLLLATTSYAFDNGQYQNVDPKIRDWFKSIRSPNGIPCCDVSDGHLTGWRKSEDPRYEFEVPIAGKWRVVPPDAVVRSHSNPTGSAVVWYVRSGEDSYWIRCFILEAQG